MDVFLKKTCSFKFSNRLAEAIRYQMRIVQVAVSDVRTGCDFDFDGLKPEIDFVLEYLSELLNTGNWSDVCDHVREAFTQANFLKVLLLIKQNQLTCNNLSTVHTDLMKCLDAALLMGLPIENHPDIVHDMVTFLETVSKNKQTTKQNKLEERMAKVNQTFIHENILDGIDAQPIPVEDCCSLEKFRNSFYEPKIPVKLLNCVNHWPALTKWTDINYLLEVAGNRTVPIEIGLNYADENWTQKLMKIEDFILNHFLDDDPAYLAQHNLFDQVPQLKHDIKIPDYCCLSRCHESNENVAINAWFGPKGTISQLHYDPNDNLLVQVFGTKTVILCSPDETENLYVHETKMLFNTSQVNPMKPNYEKFPKFKNVKLLKCVLRPGEMLFIPEKWWHHIESVQKSFSVSFWWK